VAIELGAIDWRSDYPLRQADGSTEQLPDTFASGDHPFHIAKEQSTLDALRDGRLPRWFSYHQGGFPAEFYPIGADLIVAAGYALGLGQVPLPIVHKLSVIGVLLLPLAAYWAIVRRDGLPPSVALVAGLLHLFLPGSWLAGGPDELLRMGLWPNVLAVYMTLPLALWSADYARRGERRGLVLAAGAATLAIYVNPRSLVAIVCMLTSVGVVAGIESIARHDRLRFWRRGWKLISELFVREGPVPTPGATGGLRRLAWRLTALVVIVGLLSSALLAPLRARQDLYTFPHFVEFTSFADIWRLYSQGVPVEVIVLAAFGAVFAWLRSGFHARVLGLSLPLSYAVVMIAGWLLRDLTIFAQLEGPRLLPVLRPATIFLAALGLFELARLAARAYRARSEEAWAGVATSLIVVFFLLTPISSLAEDQRGLPEVETTNQPNFTETVRSARAFEALAGPLDRPLVAGSPVAEHGAFWIPALTGRNVFLIDWIWHWRPIDGAERTQLDDQTDALDATFLRRHGLSIALVDTGRRDLLDAALAAPHLRLLDEDRTGRFAIFRFEDGQGGGGGQVAIDPGKVERLDAEAERIVIEGFASEPGTARIAVNAYPAWQATVNGDRVDVVSSADGYVELAVPAGDVRIELVYTVEPVVWAGRALVALGLSLLAAIVGWPASRWRVRAA
jgi:hypothetical protein